MRDSFQQCEAQRNGPDRDQREKLVEKWKPLTPEKRVPHSSVLAAKALSLRDWRFIIPEGEAGPFAF